MLVLSIFNLKTQVETVQHKLNAQSLRLFGLHSNDVKDAHRAGAIRLKKKSA